MDDNTTSAPSEATPEAVVDAAHVATTTADAKPPASLLADDDAQTRPAVPDQYDLKMPEHAALGDDVVDEIAAYAKSQGLSNEQAQAQLDRENSLMSKYAEQFQEKQQKVFEEQVSLWADETKNDPEIGGARLQQHVQWAQRVLRRFGSDELRQSLNVTGFGNRREVIRFLSAIGKVMGDDTFVTDGKPAQKRELQPHERLYGPDPS